MPIQNISEDVMLVELPPREPMIAVELEAVNERISKKSDFDVIIDFTKVEVITSSSIGNLIILRDMLKKHGRRLILCNVASVTKCIFAVAGLKEIFEFVDDKPAALLTVQPAN
jgi:anti-anti-sigma factor